MSSEEKTPTLYYVGAPIIRDSKLGTCYSEVTNPDREIPEISIAWFDNDNGIYLIFEKDVPELYKRLVTTAVSEFLMGQKNDKEAMNYALLLVKSVIRKHINQKFLVKGEEGEWVFNNGNT